MSDPRWISARAGAGWLRVHYRTVLAWIQAGYLPLAPTPGRVRIDAVTLRAWLERLPPPPAG